MNYAQVKNLTFQYDKEPVLMDIDLTIKTGEWVMLTGENGAAKTTLIRNMLGLLKPDQGTCHLAEENSAGEPLLVGYIPQKIAHFNPGFPSTVYDFVASGRFPKGRWFKPLTDEDRYWIDQALAIVEMTPFQDVRMGELSGGQKQRISIARVLAMDPDFYVLDEPTAGMDERSRQVLYDYLAEERTKRQKSVLMVTHDQEEIEGYYDRHVRLVRKEDVPWRCFNLIS